MKTTKRAVLQRPQIRSMCVMAIFRQLTEVGFNTERATHDVGAAYKAKRDKLVSGHATRSVVQYHLALAVSHVLIESLEEIYATLRFITWLGQESIQS